MFVTHKFVIIPSFSKKGKNGDAKREDITEIWTAYKETPNRFTAKPR